MAGLTYDDVYEIAAEVAEEVVTKFLRNLVKLVPSSEEVVEEIQESQYQELKRLRQGKLQENAPATATKHVDYAPDELVGMGDDDDIAAIAHPEKVGGEASWAAKNNFDDVLSSVTLEKSDLVGEINQSGE